MKQILYDWWGANTWLFHAINDVHADFLDQLMLTGTMLGDHEKFPLYLMVVSLFAVYGVSTAPINNPEKGRQLGIDWLVTIGVLTTAYLFDGIFVEILKHWFNFPRPLAALPTESVHVLGSPESNNFSAPSGHASFAMVLTASLWPRLGHLVKPIAGLFALWVGISRVSVGAHFPADVLAGFLLAILLVLLINWIIRATLTGKLHLS